MNSPKLVIGDGHLGIWGALRNVFPEAEEQRCWNHRILNILDKVPKKHHNQALMILKEILYAPTRRKAEMLKRKFKSWCGKKGIEDAANLIDVDWDRMVTFFRFPSQHWQHLKTTNPVESPFAALRLRTKAAKRIKKVRNATAIIWKMLLVAEKRFRKLKSPELMRDVFLGVKYVDGKMMEKEVRKDAA